MLRKTRGQSTVEYILLVTAVIAVMIVFTTNKTTGLQGRLNTTYDTATNDINTMANRLISSHKASVAGNVVNPAQLNVLTGF